VIMYILFIHVMCLKKVVLREWNIKLCFSLQHARFIDKVQLKKQQTNKKDKRT